MTRKALTQLTAWMCAGLLSVFAGVYSASAQTGWSANLFLQPFPSPYFSDWENNPTIGSLTVFNNTGTSTEVLISLTITDRARGEIARGTSLPITVPPSPPPTQINSDRFIDWSTVSYNKNIETQAVRSGRLPEGEYTACVRIEDRAGGTLLDQVCADFTIVYPDQPQLILPVDAEQVEVPYPIFTWTPLQVPADYQIHYELLIAEILPGQTPQRALEANIPQLEILDLLTTSIQYPISALPLERGKRYAWQIRALDQNGFAPSSNQGRSEIWTFLYQGTAGEGDAIVTVVDSSTGEPVTSASVVGNGTVSRTTDLDGRAYLRNLPVGVIDLTIRRDGYRTQSASLPITEGTTSRHTIALSRIPDRVAGSIRDFYTDAPMDSVHVRYRTLRFQGGGVEEGEELVTRSVQDGSFEFADVPDEDSFLITLTRDGYALSRGAVIPRSLTGIKKAIIIASLRARYPGLQLLAGPLRCAMVMTPTTAMVSGTVVSDAGDQPITGAIVEIWKKGAGNSGQADQGIASTRTDSAGRFMIDGIEPGSSYFFRIFVSRRFHPYDTRENPLSVARAGFIEGGTHRLRLMRGTVSGVVLSLGTGDPLAHADVIILPQDSLAGQLMPDSSSWANQLQPVSHLVDPVKTDSLGRFSFEHLPINDPGHPTDRYALWSQPPGHDAVWESVRLGDDGERVTVTLRAPVAHGSITGTITSTGDGRGVGDAVIEIVYSRSGAENLSGRERGGVSYSNPDGSFTVPDLELGTPFTLSVRKAGFEPVTPGEAILLSESERTRTINLALSPFRGMVRGSVHDADGHPLFDVVISSPAAPELNASTAADGAFDIPGAPAIRLPLLFQLPGYRDTRDTVLVTQGDTALVSVVMQEYSGVLIARLIDSTSREVVRNATVSASSSLHEVSDDSGRVVFPRLPVGPVQLRVVPGSTPADSIDYRTASATAIVNLNDTTLIEVTLLRGARVSGIVRSAEDPGTFIDGARVSVEGMNDVVATSGGGGVFTLRNVPAGDSLTILVSRVGYMTRRVGGILLSPGERREGVEVMLSRAALSHLYGFQVEVDSVRDAGNGRRVVSGSIVNIPGNGVVELKEGETRIPFENLEIDGNGQPVRGYVELMTRSIGVLLHGIPASLADTSETPLRLMPSQTGTGILRSAGGTIVFRKHPVVTDLAGSRWPDEIAYDASGSQSLGLWSDSAYHGPAAIALTPTGVEDSTTLFGYRIRVDYGRAHVDSFGLHYAGVVVIPGIADTTFSFTDLHIATEPGSHTVSVAESGFREQPARFDIGEFEFHNSSLSLTAGGFRTGGYVELPAHGNTQLDFSTLRLSPDGSFRAMDFVKPVDDSLTFGTSRFAVSEVHLAPDSAGRKALLFSGELVVRSFQLFALRNMFSKPIVFSTLRYDQDGKFNGTTKFNQDVIFLAIFNVKVNNVEFTNDQRGNFIRVDGGIALVIPGLNVHGGNFRFYEDGTFVLDTVGLKFQSPLFTVSGFYVYNDSIGIGGGVELLINPVLYLAASFNYKDATHWGFAITGGRGGPAGGGIQMGAFNLYRVGGKLARSGDAWTVGINCAMAIAKPGATPVKLEPMGIEVTAGGPGGPIITGYGKLVPDSPDTTVKLWQGSLDVRITYDHPQRKFTGSATLEFVRDWKGRDIVTVTGVLALEIKGRTDGGSGIELWYLGGSASVKFLTYEVGNTTFALGQNYPWPHTFDVIYHPDNPVINGIHFDMYVGIPDLNFVIWGARFHFRTFAQMTLGGDPSLSGGVNLHASSWLDIWVIRGYASVDFEAGLRYSDCLSFSASAAFRMALYTGCCRSGCSWGICLACRCKWSQPWCCIAPCGAKACFNVSMNVAYNRDNCDQGWRFSANW